MGAFIARIAILFRGAWAKIWPWIVAQIGYQTARQAAKVPVRIAIMTAWAVFLAVVFTGLDGMGIQSTFNQNPLTGVSSDVMGLLCSVFPLHFATGLFTAYVVWRLTIITAMQVMNKAILFLFGA